MPDAPRHLLVFDSGIGGLGVVNALRNAPHRGLRIDYLADNAVFPYGEKSDAFLLPRVISLVLEGVAATRPDAVIIACNTASTFALPALRSSLDIPVIGCVPPVRWAARETQTGAFCILATAATARRPYLAELKATYAPDAKMLVHGGRRLADLAEQAFLGQNIAEVELKKELNAVFDAPEARDVDVIGLGCTHYTFLREQLEAASPAGLRFLDPAEAVARQTLRVLDDSPIRVTTTDEADMQAQAQTTPGRMFMTASPSDVPRLKSAIARFGYQDIEIWPQGRGAASDKGGPDDAGQ